MAAEVGSAYCGWPDNGLPCGDQCKESSIARVPDHGSISFGRFAVETLSWEKRSVFSHNSRQEELEQCSARGLVSQRRAYFEEFYKNLRAVKVQSSKQQPAVKYGERNNTNSADRSCEEDKRDAEPKNFGDGVAKVSNSSLDEASNVAASERVKSCSEPVLIEHGHLPTSSSSKYAEEFKESDSSYLLQTQHMNGELASDVVPIHMEDKNIHHAKSALDNISASKKHTKVTFTCEADKAFQEQQIIIDDNISSEKPISLSFTNEAKLSFSSENFDGSGTTDTFQSEELDIELAADKALIHSEEKLISALHELGPSEIHTRVSSSFEAVKIVQDGQSSLDEKLESEKDTNSSSVDKADKAFQVEYTRPDEKDVPEIYSILKVEKVAQEDLTLSTMLELRNPYFSFDKATKTKSSGDSNLHKKGCISAHKTKDLSSRDLLKIAYRSKSVTKLFHETDPALKDICKSGRSIHLSKTTTDKHSSDYMPNSVHGKRLSQERQNSTVPRPFSFAIERRSEKTSGQIDSRLRLVSKSSNRSAPSLNHTKSTMIVQGTSRKEMIAHVGKGRETESRCSDLKSRTFNVLGSSKARSLKNSELKESDLHRGSDNKHHAVTVGIKRKADSMSKLKAQCISSSKAVPLLIQNDERERQKVVQVQDSSLLLKSKKADMKNPSLSVRKPSQPKPRWR